MRGSASVVVVSGVVECVVWEGWRFFIVIASWPGEVSAVKCDGATWRCGGADHHTSECGGKSTDACGRWCGGFVDSVGAKIESSGAKSRPSVATNLSNEQTAETSRASFFGGSKWRLDAVSDGRYSTAVACAIFGFICLPDVSKRSRSRHNLWCFVGFLLPRAVWVVLLFSCKNIE
jgi:hypothetical protein